MTNQISIFNKINSFKKTIEVDGDKSISIRSVLLASQAIGKSKIFNLLESEDVVHTLKCIRKLGIVYKKHNNYYEIYGRGLSGFKMNSNKTLNAGNSGTLARLILGLLVNTSDTIKIVGDKSLSKRDFSRITEPLKLFGANISSNKNKLPVTIRGSNFLRPIKYYEKLGSAQCKSAVMLAALKTPGNTQIKAKKSRNHTELFFKHLKIPIKISKIKNFDNILVKGVSNYKGFKYSIPGDISSSSFFIVLTLLSKNSSLVIKNVNINESRIGIVKILNKMNARIMLKNRRTYKGERIADLYVKSISKFKSINCPENLNSSAIDEFLIIFLVAARAKGVSSFKNLGELNKKESPRLDIAVNLLRKIGIKVKRERNNIKIFGNPNLKLGSNYEMKNFRKDHRVFMTSCIAALTLGGNWKIQDSDSVKTSFPNFFKILKFLGAKLY